MINVLLKAFEPLCMLEQLGKTCYINSIYRDSNTSMNHLSRLTNRTTCADQEIQEMLQENQGFKITSLFHENRIHYKRVAVQQESPPYNIYDTFIYIIWWIHHMCLAKFNTST